ncbi:MAG: peptide chain release factor 2 [Candidatus Omnitrophota bacterium]|jgi:peptide chain release factor 2|nr:MAG: peptide chain release factor 2 [Candidatus Omnitrophota bacterium]
MNSWIVRKAVNNASKSLGGFFDIEGKREEISQMEEKVNAPGFWNHPQEAQEITKKIKRHKDLIIPYEKLHSRFSDLGELIEMAAEEDEEEHEAELETELTELEEEFAAFELKCTLSGEHDASNCFLNIHPGAGGTESCDWASMLMRMYLRHIERRGWKADIVDFQEGDEAGIKNVTIHVKGEYAYGYLRAEVGVHRLVRISPFDANSRRHTSFTAVHVIPEVDEELEVDIDPNDLRIDTYRSTGAGGQHVNTTDSAIRITHIPTNIVVTCQNERSQRQNKLTAMKILNAKLVQMMEEEQADKIDELTGEKRDIAWGNQIRSYVFHPYNMIKDHRTGVEVGNVQPVMDGELDEFIAAYLRSSTAGNKKVKKSEPVTAGKGA